MYTLRQLMGKTTHTGNLIDRAPERSLQTNISDLSEDRGTGEEDRGRG